MTEDVERLNRVRAVLEIELEKMGRVSKRAKCLKPAVNGF